MRLDHIICDLPLKAQANLLVLIRAVHQNCNVLAVWIAECTTLQLIRIKAAADALCACTNILGKMTDVVIGGNIFDHAVFHHDRRFTDPNLFRIPAGHHLLILPVVGTAVLIEEHIPVYPGADPVVHVTDDIVGISLTGIPGNIRSRLALLRSYKELFREKLMGNVQRTEMIAGIPMYRYTVESIACTLIAEGFQRSVHDTLLVVIPAHDFAVAKPHTLKVRTHIAENEIAFLTGFISAGFPALRCV